MKRTYFDRWFGTIHAKAEDWYRDGLIYVNLQFCSTVITRPYDEKSFLLRVDDPGRISHYADSIVNALAYDYDEQRTPDGLSLVPMNLTLPEIDLISGATTKGE